MADPSTHDPEREQRFNEVMAAYVLATETGPAPDRHELRARHPDLAAELDAFFADYDRVNRLAGPLREAARDAQTTLGGSVATARPPEGTTTEGAASSDFDSTRPNNGSSHPPAAGARLRYFGDYELTGEIARGGMGIVYHARQV